MLFRTFALLSFAVLVGCAAKPPITKSESITSLPPIATLIIPDSELSIGLLPLSSKDIANKIRYVNYINIGSGNYSDADSVNWKIINNEFIVEKFKALYVLSRADKFINKVSVSYNGSIDIKRVDRNYHLTYFLNNKNYYASPDMLNGKVMYEVVFNPADILSNISRAQIPWAFEINSDFGSDAIYANFTRATKKAVLSGVSGKDPVTGKIFKERFWINVAGRDISIEVETYPYRNGSKVVVSAVLFGSVTGSTIDFTKTAEALKKEIERIVRL